MKFFIKNSIKYKLVLIFNVFVLIYLFFGLVGEKKYNSIGRSNSYENLRYKYVRSIKNVAIIVIDALRIDFLNESTMPGISKILHDGKGYLFHCRVNMPTVTLPRIKALVSGDIPTYWDVIQNFNTPKMIQDNFIFKASEKNLIMKFYGDDTWIKLFPNEFTLFQGVSSFFVTDFWNVDKEVTQHVQNEIMTNSDWDILVLHYLGLDHIGHVHGPFSSIIPKKLKEMDEIITKLFEYVSSKYNSNEQPSFLIICGDHGMANVGGHGGNTYNEIMTPFLVLSTKNFTNSGLDYNSKKSIPLVEQIDIANTVSFMLGLEFPKESRGKIVWDIFSHLSSNEILNACLISAQHLQNFLEITETRFSEELSQLILNLTEGSNDIKYIDQLLSRCKTLVNEMSSSVSNQKGEKDSTKYAIAAALIALSNLLMTSGSMKMSYCIISFFITALCLLNQLWIWIGFVLIHMLWNHFDGTFVNAIYKELNFIKCIHYLAYFLNFSSSLIEEEHYIWYYLWATGILTICYKHSTSYHHLIHVSNKSIMLLTFHRIGSKWNQTGQKWNHLEDLLDIIQHYKMIQIVVFISILVIIYQRQKKLNALSFLSLISVMLFKCAPVNYLVTFESYFNIDCIHLILVFIMAYILSSLKNGSQKTVIFTNVWIDFTILLQKYENLPLITLILLQMENYSSIWKFFVDHEKNPLRRRSLIYDRTILLMWLSYSVFFYQGNSNSISTIDVNSGYIGLNIYNETIAGILIFCNTYSLPLFVFLLYFDNLNQESKNEDEIIIYSDVLVRISYNTTIIYFLVIILFQDHLFIWSVFTPKLLYLIAQNIFYVLIIFTVSIVD